MVHSWWKKLVSPWFMVHSSWEEVAVAIISSS